MAKCFFVWLSLVGLSLVPLQVSAHVLQTDGSIGVTFHVDPEDDPVVNEPAHFYFDVKDKAGKFLYGDCDCVFQLIDSGNNVVLDSPYVGVTLDATVKRKGIYKAVLTGRPIPSANFQAFKTSFEVRFAREVVVKDISSGKAESDSAFWLHMIHYGIFAVGFAVAIYLYIKDIKNSKK